MSLLTTNLSSDSKEQLEPNCSEIATFGAVLSEKFVSSLVLSLPVSSE